MSDPISLLVACCQKLDLGAKFARATNGVIDGDILKDTAQFKAG